MFFLIKAFGRNIELRVKLSYVLNIVPYVILINIDLDKFNKPKLNRRIQNQSLLFYLKYFVLYELMRNPTPSFAEEQIWFSPLK